MNAIKRFYANESGATAIEYALIATLIALVVIPATTTLGATVSAKFSAITVALK